MAVDLNKPLTPEAMWQDFLAMGCVVPGTDTVLVAELRLAFYAGLGAMLQTLPAKLRTIDRDSGEELIAKLRHDIGTVLTGG